MLGNSTLAERTLGELPSSTAAPAASAPMKNIFIAIHDWLLGDPDIAATVGGVRVYIGILPQAMRLPSIVYNAISDIGDYHMAGSSHLMQCRVQIDAWATTYAPAIDLANLVRNRMDQLRGVTVPYGSNSPQNSIFVSGSFLDNGRTDYDQVAQLCRMSRDYLVWYQDN